MTLSLPPVIVRSADGHVPDSLAAVRAARGAGAAWVTVAITLDGAGRPVGCRVPCALADLVRELRDWAGLLVQITPAPGQEAPTATAVLRGLAAHWPGPSLLLASGAPAVLETLRDAAPSWPRAFITSDLSAEWGFETARLATVAVVTTPQVLSASRIASLTEAGLDVLADGVDDPATARRLWHDGVRAVITDTPAALNRRTRE